MYWHMFWERVITHGQTIVFGCFLSLWTIGIALGTWWLTRRTMKADVKRYLDADAETEITKRDQLIAALKEDLKEMKGLNSGQAQAIKGAVGTINRANEILHMPGGTE